MPKKPLSKGKLKPRHRPPRSPDELPANQLVSPPDPIPGEDGYPDDPSDENQEVFDENAREEVFDEENRPSLEEQNLEPVRNEESPGGRGQRQGTGRLGDHRRLRQPKGGLGQDSVHGVDRLTGGGKHNRDEHQDGHRSIRLRGPQRQFGARQAKRSRGVRQAPQAEDRERHVVAVQSRRTQIP